MQLWLVSQATGSCIMQCTRVQCIVQGRQSFDASAELCWSCCAVQSDSYADLEALALMTSASLSKACHLITCPPFPLLLVQGQVPGFSTRLHLKVGRDLQDITVYRNVSVVGLTTTFNGGIAITVSAHTVRLAASTSIGNCNLFCQCWSV